MSQSSGQPQQTSSQGFNTTTSEDDRHDHFDLFHSTNGLTENHQSTTESSSQESESSSASSDSSSSMEDDDEHDYVHPSHLAIIIPNYFHYPPGHHHQPRSTHHCDTSIHNTSLRSSRSNSSSSSSGDSVILLQSRGVQTDLNYLEENEQPSPQQNEKEEEDEFFDADQNQTAVDRFKQN